MSDIRVISPGMYSTFQDAGRFGFRHLGVPISGAMDQSSSDLANLLVQNDPSEAVLEITLLGPKLEFKSEQVVALTGADLGARLDRVPIGLNKTIQISAGQTLSFGRPVDGCRSYLSVAGGFAIDKILGSYSTYEAAGLGAPALKKEDLIGVKKPKETIRKRSSSRTTVDYGKDVVQIVLGPEGENLSQEFLKKLTASTYTITQDSNRMAYKLASTNNIPWDSPSIVSSAVMPGTIQLPPDGNPIILMRDSQTTGGYARVAVVRKADLDVLAQKRPGDQIRFDLEM